MMVYVWNTTGFSLIMRTRTISNPEDGPVKALLDWVTSEQSVSGIQIYRDL